MLRGIIKKQRVSAQKVARARELRQTMTEEERILWQHLRGHRMAGLHFRRQQIIDGFIVDFYCDQAGLVVEVDGPIHETHAEYDAERDQILRERGLRVVRFSNEAVRLDLARVLTEIEAACRQQR